METFDYQSFIDLFTATLAASLAIGAFAAFASDRR